MGFFRSGTGTHSFCIPSHEFRNARSFKPTLPRGRLLAERAGCSFMHVFHGAEDFLRTIRQPVDPPHPSFCLAVRIFFKCRVNAGKDSFQRKSRLLPRGDQRPVQRRQHQQRSTPPLEMFFDLRVVVEIVLQGRRLSLPRDVALPQPRARDQVALVNDPQSLQGERLVYFGDEFRFTSDQSRQSAGGDAFRVWPNFPPSCALGCRPLIRCGRRTIRSADCRRC